MKKLLFTLLLGGISPVLYAQTQITAADMPVAGDTLRYSTTVDTNGILDLAVTGTGVAWDFSTYKALIQGRDDYKTAAQVNITYAITISPSAYGYKVADSFPTGGVPLPVSITDMYTFFNKKTGPARFIAEAFAGNLSGIPTPVNYSDEDEWYFFPLTYGKHDSSTFNLSFSLPTLGAIKQKGYRVTDVDAEGTIVTPFYTSPQNCIRVRSVINEIDSISFGVVSFGIPRNTVEYKWLVNGGHYPALWVTTTLLAGNETVTSIRYRDSARNLTPVNVSNTATKFYKLIAYPNPSANGIVYLSIPTDWKQYTVELFDIQGKLAATYHNTPVIDMQSLSAGQYAARVVSGGNIGYVYIQH